MDGECIAEVQGAGSFGDWFRFPTEAEAVLAAMAWCKAHCNGCGEPKTAAHDEECDAPF